MLANDIEKFGGYIDPKLNIYITKYGAWMSNCSKITPNSSKKEKEKYLNKYH